MTNELCSTPYAIEKGRLIDNIPAIIGEDIAHPKRFPIWAARFHQERTARMNSHPEWKNWSYTPGELAVYPVSPNDDVLHVITCYERGLTEAGELLLAQFKPNAPIVQGEYAIDGSSIFDRIIAMKQEQGVIPVKRADIQKYTGNDFLRTDVLGNRFQRLLFRQKDEVPKIFAERSAILKDTIKTSFAPFPEGTTAMGQYFANSNGKVPKIMAWGVGRLGDRSQACAVYLVGNVGGRLVSVAPEALVAKNNAGVREMKRYTPTEAKQYSEGVRTLRETFGDSPLVRKIGVLEGKV